MDGITWSFGGVSACSVVSETVAVVGVMEDVLPLVDPVKRTLDLVLVRPPDAEASV